MNKEILLHTLEEKVESYRESHPSTAEMDITIFQSYCSGQNAVQISMAIPCSESTVYRAIRRVKDFLEKTDPIPIIDILRTHIASLPPIDGPWDAESVIELIFVSYSDYNRIEPPDVRHGFQALRQLLEQGTLGTINQIMDTVCDLCIKYERTSFVEGIKLGFRLANELAK